MATKEEYQIPASHIGMVVANYLTRAVQRERFRKLRMRWYLPHLQEFAEKNGVSAEGKKADIIERLADKFYPIDRLTLEILQVGIDLESLVVVTAACLDDIEKVR